MDVDGEGYMKSGRTVWAYCRSDVIHVEVKCQNGVLTKGEDVAYQCCMFFVLFGLTHTHNDTVLLFISLGIRTAVASTIRTSYVPLLPQIDTRR